MKTRLRALTRTCPKTGVVFRRWSGDPSIGTCVEVGARGRERLIGNSTQPAGAKISVPASGLRDLVGRIKAGTLDLPQ